MGRSVHDKDVEASFWGPLTDDVLGVFGIGSVARAKRRKARKRMAGYARKKLETGRDYGETILSQIEKGGKARLEGFESAEKYASSAQRNLQREAKDKARQNAADLATRYGGGQMTTAYDDALAGLSSQSSRNLANIDAQFANALTQLAVQKGEAIADTGMERADALRGRLATEQEYTDAMARIYSDPSLTGSNSGTDLLALGIDLLAAYYTGGASLALSAGGKGPGPWASGYVTED